MTDANRMTSPPWALRLNAELDAADQRAREVMADLDQEQLNWRESPARWSVGQCIEHLCVANEAYLPAIRASLRDRPRTRVEEIKPGGPSRWFIKNFIEPSSETKSARAPRKIVPSTVVDASVLDRFLRSNQAAREVIAVARDHDVNRIRFWNPLVSGIRFTVGTGLEIVVGHERRHLLQAERVKSSPGFPRARAGAASS